ncbi:MAG: TAXI family TRAP transporter solute-binding subunit [Longimicrobiales bacterium]|nr:TAXI family TRAP transporter solute-binding subunit [Longimicrobiales bacterium]
MRRTLQNAPTPTPSSLLAITLLLAAPLLGGCEAASDRDFLSLGTGGTGGVYYPLGGALANRLSLADSTRRYTAEVSGGSVENVNRVLAGQVDLGFALSVSIREAVDGGAVGAGRLRVVAPLYPNLVHVMVREGAGIGALAELAGKRVSVGSPGSGTEQTARQLLAVAGLDYDGVDERFLSFSESAAALRDGAIDAAILSVGFPASAVLEGTTGGGVGLLALSEDEVAALTGAYPTYQGGYVPPGVYPGVGAPIRTVAMMNWVVARDDLPGDVAEHLLNILAGSGVSLGEVHEMARQIDLNALGRAPAPLHPASEAWRAARTREAGR